MLWAALAYASGIVTGFYAWRPPLWWLVAAIVFSASGAYFLRRRALAAFALGLSALFVTAALTMQLRVPEKHQTDVLAFTDGRDLIVTAHVTKEGNLREKTPGDAQQRLDLETEQVVARDGKETRSLPSTPGFASVSTVMRQRTRKERMNPKNPRPRPRTCSATASAYAFPSNSIRRTISAIQARSTTRDIWRKTESWHSDQPRQRRSNCCQGLPETVPNFGGPASAET